MEVIRSFKLFFFVGVILFAGTVFVIVVLSLLTAPIPKEELAGLTWATIKARKARSVTPQANAASDDRMCRLLLLVLHTGIPAYNC